MPMSLPGQEELRHAQPHETATPGMGRRKREGEVTLGWEEVEKAKEVIHLSPFSAASGIKTTWVQIPVYHLPAA